MSEIDFVREFGDAFRAAIAADAGGQSAAQRKPDQGPAQGRPLRNGRSAKRWLRTRRGHLLIGLASVVVAGCAATVALDNPATTTVAYGITCLNRAGQWLSPVTVVDGSRLGSNVNYGPDPVKLCGNALGLAADQLTVCVRPSQGVFVLPRNGDSRQCQARGWLAYTKAYATAVRRVGDLEDELLGLYASRACWPPRALEAAAAQAIRRNALVGWGTFLQPESTRLATQYPGRCGNFSPVTVNTAAPGHAYSSAGTVGIDPTRHTVDIYTSAPRPEIEALQAIQERLMAATLPTVGNRHPHVTTVAELRSMTLKALLADRSTRGLHLQLQVDRAGPSFSQGDPPGEAAENRLIFSRGGVEVVYTSLDADGLTFVVSAAS